MVHLQMLGYLSGDLFHEKCNPKATFSEGYTNIEGFRLYLARVELHLRAVRLYLMIVRLHIWGLDYIQGGLVYI